MCAKIDNQLAINRVLGGIERSFSNDSTLKNGW
jgi:hypothetical protein